MKKHEFSLIQRVALMLLTVGLVVGGVLAQGCGSDEDPRVTLMNNLAIYGRNSAASFVPVPDTIEGLLDRSEVIVIGTVNSVAGTGNLRSYNEADNIRIEEWLDTLEAETGERPEVYPPYTDFLVDIEKIILNNGLLTTEEPLVLRMLGRSANSKRSTPSLLRLLQDGDRRLFTLNRNPDGTYGLYGWWSHFVIDGKRVTFSDDLRTPIHFTDKASPAEFISALELAVAERSESGS